MIDRLQKLKENLEFYCKQFEERNEQGLKDYLDGTFFASEWYDSSDDAFEKGQSFGMYFEQYDILNEITAIIEEGK